MIIGIGMSNPFLVGVITLGLLLGLIFIGVWVYLSTNGAVRDIRPRAASPLIGVIYSGWPPA